MNARLTKLSVCPCGFPALREDIPLGTEYIVDPAITLNVLWICGGCGQRQRQRTMFVMARGQSREGFLPIELFTLESHTKTPTTDGQE